MTSPAWFGWVRCLLGALALWLGCLVPAHTAPLGDVQVLLAGTVSEGGGQAPQPVRLPHFVQQPGSVLRTVHWSFELPDALGRQHIPGLLIPQPIQGMILRVGGRVIYELPVSDSETLRAWYRPVLVQIPPELLQTDGGPAVLAISQTGHLRGWFMAPILSGPLHHLRPYYDGFQFLSQTLSITSNVLSALAGLFLLWIGWRSGNRPYWFSGCTSLIWSLLFAVALTQELPTEAWFTWRLVLYAMTGGLIYCVCMFLLHYFEQAPPQAVQLAMLVLLNVGWVVFAIVGRASEAWLDTAWVAIAILVYIVVALKVMVRAARQGQFRRLTPVLAHWGLTTVTAAHDYVLQAGAPVAQWLDADSPLWHSLVMQHIYLCHLTLPGFVVMALWLLTQDHLRKTREKLQHERHLRQVREAIVHDIHDGVGARLNLLLWGLRMRGVPAAQTLEEELQRCIEEMRFAIQPGHTSAITLSQVLGQLCERLNTGNHQGGAQVVFEEWGEPDPALRADVARDLYKAAQECLSNALRHGQATRVRLQLRHHPGEVELLLEDNGQGIVDWDNERQRQWPERPRSLGLKSLQARIAGRQGHVHITSGPTGTCVRLTLDAQAQRPWTDREEALA